MNLRLLRWIPIIFLSPSISCFGGTAEVHLYSLSVRFQPATTQAQGLTYKLDLTSGSPAEATLNGELAPLSTGAATSHGSFYRLRGDVFLEPVLGNLFLNVPSTVDVDTNGIPDFFEFRHGVPSTSTTGASEDLERGNGKVTAVWNRSASSSLGTARLTMDAYSLAFEHTTEIQQFVGRLNYGSTETNITGSVALTNISDASRRLSGPMNLDKLNVDQLGLKSGTWMNEVGQVLSFQATEPLARRANNFVAPFVVRDGDPSTPPEDYVLWLIRIHDPNDTDRNGLPDIADRPLPRQPSLAISASGANVVLSVSGDIGKRHEIQQIPSLNLTNWTSIVSLVLTNDPHLLTVSAPTNRLAFWRVRLE